MALTMIGKAPFRPAPLPAERTLSNESPAQRRLMQWFRDFEQIVLGLLTVGAGDSGQKFAFSLCHSNPGIPRTTYSAWLCLPKYEEPT
jgi:hypothetical protein